MKIAIYISLFLGGIAACYLFISLGIIGKIDLNYSVQREINLELPTYLSFLSVMLTAVTVILTTFAVAVGLIAVFTFSGIKQEVQNAVKKETDKAFSEEEIQNRINKVAFKSQGGTTVAELEAGFDPNDENDR